MHGEIDYVGSAAVAASRHAAIAEQVLPLLDEASDRRFSEPNRWGGSGLEEQPLRPELVAEVRYDKVQGRRFRHGTKLLRFRPDKDPRSCTWAELRPPRDRGGPTVADLLATASTSQAHARAHARRRPYEAVHRRSSGFGRAPGRLHARRLARHLREVRRVRRLPDAGRLVSLDPFEQHPEVADGVVDRRLDVAERGESRRHRDQREVLGLDVGQLVPGDGRRHRGVRPRLAPSTPTRSCGRGRSGCSR